MPGEHAGVPCDTGQVDQLARPGVGRLLLEPEERIRADALDARPVHRVGPEVAIVGRREARPHPERHERLFDRERAHRQPLDRDPDDIAEAVLVDDPVVRRQDDHDVIIRTVDDRTGEGDRRSGVPAGRLDDQPDVRDLIADQLAVAPVRHAEDVRLVGQRQDPPHGVLKERPIVDERQEGLRALLPAEGPQSGPATAGEDDDVHGGP